MGIYDDIIELSYKKSLRHTPMSLHDRAAQFSPFAALTGYDEAVAEASRLTEEKRKLSDDEQAYINEQLKLLAQSVGGQPQVDMIYFKKDTKKQGGQYCSYSGAIKKIDKYEGVIITEQGEKIAFDDILKICLK